MTTYFSCHEYLPRQIKIPPQKDVNIIIVIPCCCERNLLTALGSLCNCIEPDCSAEVIVVINAASGSSEGILKQNLLTYKHASAWIIKNKKRGIKYFLIAKNDLPERKAGVGLARKIGMDEAARRFCDINKKNGIIVCYDSDCTCDPNLLTSIEAHFSSDIPADGCSIRFEHPLSGNDYPPEVYSGIVNYELYLRYYKQGLQYANLPFAFHTIGSSMAVRAGAYMKSGGMNMRKAGEDFYFLQKIIELGRFTELNSTCIYPSPRPSSRVPFGTGMAIEKWLQGRNDLRVTFDPGIFYDLKLFCKLITGLDYRQMTAKKIENRLSEALRSFLSGNGFEDNLEEIKNNSATQNNFLKRFFRWFNAFRTLKFVHFARDNFYGNIPIEAAAGELLSEIYPGKKAVDAVNLLREYRILDAGQFA